MSKTTYRPPIHKAHEKTRTGYLLVALLALAALATVTLIAFADKAGASTGQDVADTATGIAGPVIIVSLLIATIKKVTDFPAYLKAGDWDSVTKQTLAWVVGVAGAFVLRSTPWADTLAIADVSLASANAATAIVFGLAAGSGASIFTDYLAAKDNTRSSSVPPLVGPDA